MRVYYNDGWGNICHSNDEDSLAEANVICHQLGYTGGSRYWKYKVLIFILYNSDEQLYGMDDLPIKIYHLSCENSNFLSIFQCSFSTYIDSGCTNSNSYDATVYCCKLNCI